jgi:hypothetical protein
MLCQRFWPCPQLASWGLLIAGMDGRREIVRVQEDLAT